MYRHVFLLIGCFNLIIMLIASVQGQCNKSYQTMRIQECENLLQLTHFNINSQITKTVNSWMASDLVNICRYKYKLEMCYQLLMLECPTHEKELQRKLEYIHDTFNYLCNGRIQTYIDVQPCLKYIEPLPAMKSCESIMLPSIDECSKIDKITTCVANWIERSCGPKAAGFMKVLLETELALPLPPGTCKFPNRGKEYKCSLHNVETESNTCAAHIGFSSKDLKQLMLNPLPKLNEQKLNFLCKNLGLFQKCIQKIKEECHSTNKLMLFEHFYYNKLLNYICKQDRSVVLIHNYCLTQTPFSDYRKACFIKGGRKILNSTTSKQACHSLDETIHCSLDLTRKVCNLKDYQFMRNVYQHGVKSTFFKNSCSYLTKVTIKPEVTTEEHPLKVSNTFSIVVVSVAVGCFLIFSGIVGVLMAVHAKKKKGMQEPIDNRPQSNIITRPNFVIQPHLPPYDRYENSPGPAPPPYDEIMAEDFRASNRF
ncbi:uncharacterized protein LOC115212424 [Octopus sinensis]|uniref:Uncharacterized protein LOC115212424 n=1 Tax=Octopus sinensis TaxID=2607531 RepID=A0A6P7SFP2_9MOLL|nr:uncharacterized protein LOC115212424 [Octopus sinensis]